MPSIDPSRAGGRRRREQRRHRFASGALFLACAIVLASPLTAQQTHEPGAPPHSVVPAGGGLDPLQALMVELLEGHPGLGAARERSQAARSAIAPAGTLPDPVLGVGLMSLPFPELDISMEGMTMLSLEVMQELPPRGLRSARTEAARSRAQAAEGREAVLEWELRLRLSEAWFELLLVSDALGVHHRTHASLEAFARSAEAAYTEGMAPQADLLRAQTELASIQEHMAELRQRRAVALAEVNTLVGRDVRAPVEVAFPERLRALADGDPGMGMLTGHLGDAELGAGYPTLVELEEMALRHRPELLVQAEELDAARHEVEAARIQRRPGVMVTGGYGLRSARPDMVSIGASIPLPVFRGRKQDARLAGAEAEAEAVRFDGESLRRTIRREVAEAHADLLEAREQLILLEEGVLPQARAAVESAAAAYRTGEGSFTGLMEAQTVLFRSEIQHAHMAAELGGKLARLEQAVGRTIEPEMSP